MYGPHTSLSSPSSWPHHTSRSQPTTQWGGRLPTSPWGSLQGGPPVLSHDCITGLQIEHNFMRDPEPSHRAKQHLHPWCSETLSSPHCSWNSTTWLWNTGCRNHKQFLNHCGSGLHCWCCFRFLILGKEELAHPHYSVRPLIYFLTDVCFSYSLINKDEQMTKIWGKSLKENKVPRSPKSKNKDLAVLVLGRGEKSYEMLCWSGILEHGISSFQLKKELVQERGVLRKTAFGELRPRLKVGLPESEVIENERIIMSYFVIGLAK